MSDVPFHHVIMARRMSASPFHHVMARRMSAIPFHRVIMEPSKQAQAAYAQYPLDIDMLREDLAATISRVIDGRSYSRDLVDQVVAGCADVLRSWEYWGA